MKNDYAAYYSALELEPGAPPEAVKRAYFRLLRQYPPEKDPEHFKLIRQAYDALKDGAPPPETSAFPEPEDAILKPALEQALQEERNRRYEEASSLFQDMLALRPDEPYLLLHLARAQQEAGHPQKSAKTALRLAELYPECREAYTIAALGTYGRGWYKKSLPLFRKSFALGERDVSFLTDYAAAAAENAEIAEAKQISEEILKNEKWTKDNIDYALEAYNNLGRCIRDTDDALSLLDRYRDFLSKYRRILHQFAHIMNFFADFLLNFSHFLENHEVYWKTDAAITAVETSTEEEQWIVEMFRSRILSSALEEDQRFQEPFWLALAETTLHTSSPLEELMEADDKDMKRFAMLDVQLCILKNPEVCRRDIPIIRDEYPYLYEQNREFLDQALSGDTAALFDRLKRQFFKLEYKYDGSNFLERYPEERPSRIRGIKVHDGERPFVRDGIKIGRNDPCPCGSGKKFKRCCLGKGIYD